jgi:hypothetical protein
LEKEPLKVMGDRMADTTLAPQNDKGFMSATPEDRHSYLMATDPGYASANPQDQTQYMMHLVSEGAKQNVAQYPENKPQSAMDKVKNVAGQADQAVTGALEPNPENYSSALKTNLIEGPKSGARYLYSAGKTALGMVPSMVQSVVEPAQTPEEEQVVKHGGGLSLGIHRMAQPVIQAAKDYWNPETRPTAEQALSVAPEALGEGSGNVLGGKLLDVGAPKAISTAKTVGAPLVRMAGTGIEAATTPVAVGGGVGGFVGSKLGNAPVGAEIGGAIGAGMANAAGKSPFEPMVRVPRMRNFGLEKPTYPGAPLPEAPASALGGVPTPAAEPELPGQELKGQPEPKPVHQANIEALQKEYDKANVEYQKQLQNINKYQASIEQGVEPPAKESKAYDKAHKALSEAEFHLDAAKAAAEKAGKPAIAPTEETNAPVVRGGQTELPNKGGVMGKPLQLPAGPETPRMQMVAPQGEVLPPEPQEARGDTRPFENVEPMRAKMVPAKTMAGAYEAPKETVEAPEPVPVEKPRMKAIGEEAGQIKRIGDLTREGLGGKELEPNKPIAERPKPVEEEKISSRPDKAVLQKAKASPETMDKLLKLTQVELRQLAINAGEDMGQESIGSGKNPAAAGKTPRAEVFERLLKNHSAEDLSRMVDEGKHLPTVSGGSQAADVDNAIEESRKLTPEERARIALGDKASPEAVAEQAKAFQEEYHGPERRSESRKAPMNATEMESAIKQRKPIETPFDVTEGAAKTTGKQELPQDQGPLAPIETRIKERPSEMEQKYPVGKIEPLTKDINESISKGEPDVAKHSDEYNKQEGLPSVKVKKVSEVNADGPEIADAYDEMKHDPNNPEVKKSYSALVDDVKKQFNFMKEKGIKVEVTNNDPYNSYEELVNDVKKNKTLKVFGGGNPLPEDHPLAKIDPDTGETYNNMFRAVHDYFGHVAPDNPFSLVGEENAWRNHVATLSPEAVPAMTTETRGQTNWYFNNKGVRGGMNPGAFAEQKAGLLPDFATTPPERAGDVFNHIKSGKDYAVLTAENPSNGRLSDAENLSRNEALLKDLREKGHEPIPVQGHTKDVEGETEHSFFIPDIKPEDAAELGRKHGQAAVLTSQGLHDLKTDTINPSNSKGLVVGEAAEKEPYYSRIGGQSFNVPLDFDKTITPDGKEIKPVSGGVDTEVRPDVKLSKAAAEQVAEKHIAEGEKFGSEAGRQNFISNLMKLPTIQEFTDIAKAGESGRKWYQRSSAAFDALEKAAPEYFKEGDRQKFTDFLAALSPQQSVKMNLQEALGAWSKYVDMGRPEGKALKQMLSKELTLKTAKIGNATKALAGEDLWPDLSNNRNFKVPSFSKNLKGFLDKVTNDGWQAAFAGIKPTEIQTAAGYHPLAVLTRAAAENLGWEPAEAQAAIWAFTKTLAEKGEAIPEKIRQYSEDFADLMAHDQDIRRQLSDLGIDLGELDGHLKEIERKPPVTAGASPTTQNSIGKLTKRLEGQRGKLPAPKDSGLFENTETNDRENFFKPIRPEKARMKR